MWRGYKEVKDSGGWASLIFAGSGVYRFCKYRIGFENGLTTRLRHIAPSLEVAADTLHPGWRDLLRIIDQSGPRRYTGHPHEWVTVDTGPALPLQETYSHLPLPNGFDYQFVEDCVIDQEVFGVEDPRHEPGVDPDLCQICKEKQSDNATSNYCSCFPNLFGCVRCPSPVQIFHTASGKNNGVVARCVCRFKAPSLFNRLSLFQWFAYLLMCESHLNEAQLLQNSSVSLLSELMVWM